MTADKFTRSEQSSPSQIRAEIAKIAFPAILCQFFIFLQEIINLIFVGRLTDKESLIAVGLGNTIINVFILGVYIGLNAALSTFVSQALGSGNTEICGVYLWRGRLIYTIVIILEVPIFLFAKPILVSLGQDEGASSIAQLYMLTQLPGMYVQGLLDLDRQFLTSFGKSDLTMFC